MFLIAMGLAIGTLAFLFIYMSREIHQREMASMSRKLNKSHKAAKTALAHSEQIAKACHQLLNQAMNSCPEAGQDDLCRLLVQHVEPVLINSAESSTPPSETLLRIILSGEQRLLLKNIERRLGQRNQKFVSYWQQQTAGGYLVLCQQLIQQQQESAANKVEVT